jgi:flagellar M-ring protein FliF
VLGPGRAAIRVSADLNWDQTETTSETFQPSGAKGGNLPQEEETTTETYGRGAPRPPRGIPGVPSNLSIPPAVPLAADTAAAGQYTNAHVSNKYVVNKVVERRIAAPGKIRRLSIAVLLDQSISPAQQQSLKSVLAAAAGLDRALPAKGGRGDKIELLPMAFDKTAAIAETAAADTATKQSFKTELTRSGAAVLVVLLVAVASLFLAKQLLGSPREPLDTLIDEPVSLSDAAAPRESRLDLRASPGAGPAPGPAAPAAERPRHLASQRPDEVARQLQSWMKE